MLKRLWRWLTRQKAPPAFDKIKRDPTPGVYNEQGVTAGELAKALPDLAELGKKVVEYPPVREQSTQDWVTEQLERRTGGITRHPYDKTQYPTAPTEADLAAREYVNQNMAPGYSARAYFSKGYSMRYLGELLARADKRDASLSTEDLMALRARGLA